MSKSQRVLPIVTTVLVGTIGVLFLLSGLNPPAQADPGTRYVAPDGDDARECTNYSNRCRTVQRAVDAADPGDEILVATGTYTAAGQPWVVDVRKNVTIRGGYSGDFATWNPDTYPTTLDGEGQRRVMHIFGIVDITPTLETLRLTRGATDFDGGGISATSAHVIISGCQIFDSASEWNGGGISLNNAVAMLANNDIFSNTTGGNGGGVFLDGSANATLVRNRIFENVASNDGGGIALYWDSDNASLTGNQIHHNQAAWGGGGIAFHESHNIRLVNNLVADNHLTLSGSDGAGIQLAASDALLLHTTIAHNSGGNGSGVSIACIWSGPTCTPSTATLTNTILVSHTVGIDIREHNTVILEAVLWGEGIWANGSDWYGSGTIVTGALAHNYWGDPGFVNPAAGDYHIGPGMAINRGVAAGVTNDIDGDPRPAPLGTLPDLGADEFSQRCIYLPLVVNNR